MAPGAQAGMSDLTVGDRLQGIIAGNYEKSDQHLNIIFRQFSKDIVEARLKDEIRRLCFYNV